MVTIAFCSVCSEKNPTSAVNCRACRSLLDVRIFNRGPEALRTEELHELARELDVPVAVVVGLTLILKPPHSKLRLEEVLVALDGVVVGHDLSG